MAQGEIQILFFGIGVQVQNVPPIAGLGLNVPHRAVLITNAAQVTLHGHDIPPHQVRLSSEPPVPPGQLVIPPGGATLTISNANDQPITQSSYDKCYGCAIYNLKQVSGNQNLQLNPDVVVNQQPPASVYFDVTEGHFSAFQQTNGAAGTKLTIATTDNPQLTITPWRPGNASTITFGGLTAKLSIFNDANLTKEYDPDFLLNFQATDRLPDTFPTQKKDCSAVCGPPITGDLGPGCSNSNYP